MATWDIGYDAAGVALDFDTIANAVADGTVSAEDTLELYYSTAHQDRVHYMGTNTITATKVVNLVGGLPQREACVTTWHSTAYNISGDLSGIASPIRIANLTIINAHTFSLSDSSSSATWQIENCLFIAGYRCISNATANPGYVRNCCFIAASSAAIFGTLSSGLALDILHCTFIACATAIYYDAGATVKNCLFLRNSADDRNSTTDGGCYTSGSGTSDGTAYDYDDAHFWRDEAGNWNPTDYRITTDSTFYQSGVTSGVATDCDGNPRHETTPTPGWHEGTATPFGITHPTAAQTLDGVTFANWDGSVEGTLVPDPVSTTPTGLTISDNGDGVTWTVAATGIGVSSVADQYADSLTATVGAIDSGALANTQANDGTELVLTEVNGTPGFDYRFVFSSIATSGLPVFFFNGYYDGNAGHNVILQQWNYADSTWDAVTGAAQDFPTATGEQSYRFDLLLGTDYYDVGEAQLRMNHTSAGNVNHHMHIDQMYVETITDEASLHIYNHATDALVTILDDSALTGDLTAGTSVYARAVEVGGALSARYPASTGVTVPALTFPTSAAPTGLTVIDTGDGVTWTVTATGQAANAAIYIYNQSGDALITILDGTALTKDLTAGTSIYAKALEADKVISARYPAATGVAVPTLAILTSTAPTALAITDTGDGITWTVTATGQASDAAILLYNHATDALVAIVDGSAATADLTAGTSVYARALDDSLAESARYPAAAGVAVPSLAPTGGAPTAPTLAAADNGDGTATVTVSGADTNTTNEVFIRAASATTWPSTASATITENGSASVTLSPGLYIAKVLSTDTAGEANIGASDPVVFRMADTSDVTTWYRVTGILHKPGSGVKTLALSKIDKPIVP